MDPAHIQFLLDLESFSMMYPTVQPLTYPSSSLLPIIIIMQINREIWGRWEYFTRDEQRLIVGQPPMWTYPRTRRSKKRPRKPEDGANTVRGAY